MDSLTKKQILKTITWRIIGSLDTIILSSLVSKDISIGVAVGGAEVITKTILYFTHEKIWFNYLKK